MTMNVKNIMNSIMGEVVSSTCLSFGYSFKAGYLVGMKCRYVLGAPTAAPNDCFLQNISSVFAETVSKYCLKFSITWGRQKSSRWRFHSCFSLTKEAFFWWTEKDQKNSFFCNTLNWILSFGKIILKSLQFRKDLSSLRMTKQVQIL